MLPARIMTIMTLFLLLSQCRVHAGKNGCMSYGHSCWGGHGKRSEASQMSDLPKARSSGWVFNSLFNPKRGSVDILGPENLARGSENDEGDNFLLRDYENHETRTGGDQPRNEGEWAPIRKRDEAEAELIVSAPESPRELHIYNLLSGKLMKKLSMG